MSRDGRPEVSVDSTSQATTTLLDALTKGPAAVPLRREIPSLDGLRAASIAFVLIGHQFIAANGRSLWARFAFAHATLGVRIFFLISGYLITTLLLREKQSSDRISLRRFYARRALRILPAFYVFVGAIAVLQATGLITLPPLNIAYVLTYTVNFVRQGAWYTGHIWSLSVEEQFYLIWPMVVAFLPRRASVALATLGVLSAVTLRWLGLFGGIVLIDPARSYAFPFVCGSIATGCLVALFEESLRPVVRSCRRWASPVAVGLFAFAFVVDSLGIGDANRLLRIPADMGLAAAMATWAWVPESRIGRLLNWSPVRFVGRLSYSLYLWQQLFFQHYSGWMVTRPPINLIATVTLACTSYFVLEKPLLRLRQRLRPASR